MQIDKKSLIDLGVLPNAAGEWPLGRLLDHTHSRQGLSALKALLSAPLDDPGQIVRRQQLMVALPDVTQHVQWTPLIALADDVERYLDSNYIIVPESRAELAIFTMRFRPIGEFVEAKLLSLSQLIERCSEIRERLRLTAGDRAFEHVVERLDRTANDALRMALRDAASSPATRRLRLCALDRCARVACRDLLRDLVDAVYALDAFASLAAAATHMPGASYPQVQADADIGMQLTDVRHPLIDGGVANAVDVRHDERVMFLTGPNMAGKSTLLRAVGLAVYFAHVGLPVAARGARLSLVDRLMSSLTIEDNMLRGESLYLAEVRRVKAVVQAVAAKETVVALLDEVFRGTNVKDAADATALLLAGLARVPRGMFFVASHLVEVAERHRSTAGIGFWCMHVDSAGDQPTFTFALRRGVSDVRLGMRLLEREGVAALLRTLADSRTQIDAS